MKGGILWVVSTRRNDNGPEEDGRLFSEFKYGGGCVQDDPMRIVMLAETVLL